MIDIIRSLILLILVSVTSAIMFKSVITTLIIDRDNPCGMDDFEDFEIKEESRLFKPKKDTIYQ